jgi:hypothetical protein
MKVFSVSKSAKNIPRPTTARPSAPRKRQTAENDDITQPKSNGSKKGASTLIVDKDSDSDDDFVVKEQKLLDEQQKFTNDKIDDADMFVDGKNAQHGALVKKILESKEQLENGSMLNKKTEIVSLIYVLNNFLRFYFAIVFFH